MRRALVLALVALGAAACGDNALPDGEPLVQAEHLVIVAHQDDDLLFMQPDVIEAVQRGEGVTLVYVTAGNGTKGVDVAEKRYAGLRSAYGAAAGSTDWMCGWIDIAHHTAQHCRLVDRNVSLVFLGYPDGGKQGELPNSLLHLWEGTIDQARTIAGRTTFYDRDSLIATVTDIVRQTAPSTVHTLEVASTHGRDHSDHMIVGAIAVLALAHADSPARLLSYRGYDIATEPVNKIDPVFTATREILTHYEACVTGCGPCGGTCTTIDPTHEIWLHRRYAVGFRPHAIGQLRTGGQCLTASAGGSVFVSDCTGAQTWHLDDAGELRGDDDRCLDVLPTGELAAGACTGGFQRRFVLDDEGHLWTGVPPVQQPNMDYAHLWCIGPSGGKARAALCGADVAPVWEFVPATVATERSALGIAATGREVRLGDVDGDGKADLCAIEAGTLRCALGDGRGHFATAVQVGQAGAPLAIDPRSLTIGDVDGDGLPDACGRDAGGVLCARAATQFATERWTPTFGDAEARPGTSASLAAIDANGDGSADICGLAAEGVICAPHGLTAAPIVRSAWPDPASVLWPADLDGDGFADWCTATDAGPACGVDAEKPVTTDGVPWGWANGGTVEVMPANSATVAAGDVDGDGLADLCTTIDDHVMCARSQGRGFGPRTTLAVLPGVTAAALWLGDLDGDGRADPCVDAGTQVICTVSSSAP